MTDGALGAEIPAGGEGLLGGPLPDVVHYGHHHGLEHWVDPAESVAQCWIAPAGSTGTIAVTGGDPEAGELQWSARCALVPATRAVVLLGGRGSDAPAADFTAAHLVAENVAEFISADSGVEAGPIETLVFRLDPGESRWPEPTSTRGGVVEWHFRHRGGAAVHVTLTLPTPPGEA